MKIKHHSPLDKLIEEIEYAVDCIYNKGNIPEKSSINKVNLSRLRNERIRISNLRKFSLVLNTVIKSNLGLLR